MPAHSVFDGLDLHIPAGQRVGLVGASGAGKTTLTKLLLRLSDIQEGRILVDGQDISDTAQQSLRRQIAYVPQEALLFHRSIAENIAYGRPDATMERDPRGGAPGERAWSSSSGCRRASTPITGERGVKLSGGQRQRIAIARALLADCPVLVLDEATSALDSESEQLVQDALATLMRGRTAIVVAHRLSTVALARPHRGARRRHAWWRTARMPSSIEAGGAYANLWSRQTGAYLE